MARRPADRACRALRRPRGGAGRGPGGRRGPDLLRGAALHVLLARRPAGAHASPRRPTAARSTCASTSSCTASSAPAPDQPDWSHFDRMVALAKEDDVKLLGIIRGSPLWLTSCPEAGAESPICAPRDPREWGRLAGEVAKHARGEIDHWEIVNEPDANWAFTGSAEDYARMLSAAYDAIKAEAPEAKVVFGGVERPRQHEWVKRVFATPGADAAHKFDIAAVHLRLQAAQPPAGAGGVAHRLAPAAAGPRLRRSDLGDRARLPGRPGVAVGPELPRHGRRDRRGRSGAAAATPRSRCSPRPGRARSSSRCATTSPAST